MALASMHWPAAPLRQFPAARPSLPWAPPLLARRSLQAESRQEGDAIAARSATSGAKRRARSAPLPLPTDAEATTHVSPSVLGVALTYVTATRPRWARRRCVSWIAPTDPFCFRQQWGSSRVPARARVVVGAASVLQASVVVRTRRLIASARRCKATLGAGYGLAAGVAQLAGSRTAATTSRTASITSSGCWSWI
jgi:hypothetical protein